MYILIHTCIQVHNNLVCAQKQCVPCKPMLCTSSVNVHRICNVCSLTLYKETTQVTSQLQDFVIGSAQENHLCLLKYIQRQVANALSYMYMYIIQVCTLLLPQQQCTHIASLIEACIYTPMYTLMHNTYNVYTCIHCIYNQCIPVITE